MKFKTVYHIILGCLSLMVMSSASFALNQPSAQQLSMLKQCQCKSCDFSEMDLSNLKLMKNLPQRCNLDGINLAQSDLSQVYLMNPKGAEFDIKDSPDSVISMNKANITKANFRKANLIGVSFNQAQGESSQFTQALLSGVYFKKANLQHADFHLARIWPGSFEGANLSDADFEDSTIFMLKGISEIQPFHHSNLTNADLKGMRVMYGNTSKPQPVNPMDILWDATLCHTIMPDGQVNNRDCDKYKWWHAIFK